eukprot:COSAG02_NODE_28392_length_590_cov_1.164969_1_plen_82_part_00
MTGVTPRPTGRNLLEFTDDKPRLASDGGRPAESPSSESEKRLHEGQASVDRGRWDAFTAATRLPVVALILPRSALQVFRRG